MALTKGEKTEFKALKDIKKGDGLNKEQVTSLRRRRRSPLAARRRAPSPPSTTIVCSDADRPPPPPPVQKKRFKELKAMKNDPTKPAPDPASRRSPRLAAVAAEAGKKRSLDDDSLALGGGELLYSAP